MFDNVIGVRDEQEAKSSSLDEMEMISLLAQLVARIDIVDVAGILGSVALLRLLFPSRK